MFTPYFHNTIRKYIIGFGSLFNDIYINRVNADQENIQTLKVPLSYGPKEKFLSRLKGDPELNRPIAIDLPRMAFELVTISYDGDRKLNTLNRFVEQSTTNPSELQYQYQSVPYNFGITLDIMTKNADDASRIVEQILPFFTPQWTISLNLIPNLAYNVDIPIILSSTSLQDTYEGDYDNRRAIVWSLGFTLKGYLFGPTKKSGVIKRTYVNFYTPTTNTISEGIGVTPVSERITIYPGLLANGSPTTNSQLTIDSSLINANDNYDYIIDYDSISDTIT